MVRQQFPALVTSQKRQFEQLTKIPAQELRIQVTDCRTWIEQIRKGALKKGGKTVSHFTLHPSPYPKPRQHGRVILPWGKESEVSVVVDPSTCSGGPTIWPLQETQFSFNDT